jgi:hypothetical protein
MRMSIVYCSLVATLSSVSLLAAAGLPGCSSDSTPPAEPAATPKPNILFVIMDDLGIDEMAIFGYGGASPADTPGLSTVASAGVRFSNTWSMPACSNSRAVFFEGRFPMRTNVLNALGTNDLANSMVSPYETTAPKLLAKAGYESGMFGKFHIGLQGHSPEGLATPFSLGWSYFWGWLDETGDPSSIDTTAGGVAPSGTWPCGFVGAKTGPGSLGANTGACYLPDGTCTEMALAGKVPPGRTCRDAGGILDPEQGCKSPPPPELDFGILSAHYVSPVVINGPDGSVEAVPPTDLRARTFRATAVVDAAVSWIKSRPLDKPWMATVSFASEHTPFMQPPVDPDTGAGADTSDLDCGNAIDQRKLSDAMVESMDSEIGRLLVETGLATRSTAGLVYTPEATHTMVILVTDNGSLGTVVKAPFDATRAKGTAYQTGVWVPLIVAGPLVNSPGRAVSHMVNIADVFELFGEIAGIDVHAAVERPLDSASMLPYLEDPNQASIRTTNFTQIGENLQAGGTSNGPCVIGTGCTQIPPTKGVCEDNGGIWYGAGSTVANVPAEGLVRCCDVVDFFVKSGETPVPGITTYSSVAIRNDKYKLVQNRAFLYESAESPCVDTMTLELFEIDEAVPVPKLDVEGAELPQGALTAEQQTNYDALLAALTATLAQVSCPQDGDGNLDGVVDQKDLDNWATYEAGGKSSPYDINLDGLTDAADEAIIQANMGKDCGSP